MLITNITQAIGNTPLLEIDRAVHGLERVKLYAKLEHLNPLGSVKDRTAWYLLKDELARLKAGSRTVIEATSGNTGKAMQVLCSMHGVPFRIVTNRIHVAEIRQVLQLLGAQLLEMPGLSSCPDPTDPNNPLTFIEELMGREPGTYLHPSQYTNDRNVDAHYETTGPEIYADGGAMDFFFAGLGTSGSSRGAGRFLKEKKNSLKMVGIIAEKGQVLPGIRNGDELYEVGLFERSFYDDIVEIGLSDAIAAMLRLNRELGVLCGPTSGAAFAAAIKYLKVLDAALTEEVKACFIVCDRVEPYLSFLRQHQPQLFGLPARKDSVRTVAASQVQDAPRISVAEAATWLAQPDVLVIDLRGNLAFKAGHVPRSINMPAEVLEDQSERGVPFSSSHRLLFVCPVGEQSRLFAAFFKAHGIQCASLEGGFTAWRDADQPIERIKPSQPT